ncbi:MAG: hypothetical protein ACRER8_22275 [Pseudomonas sp.]|uniref:hypothetical protein n=1 Tax=Pseudomonas sp. TaxID=306 RepID=UPI003D6F4004
MASLVLILIGMLTAAVSSFAFGSAQPVDMRDYLCTIQRVTSSLYAAGDRHELDKKVYVGKTFTVNRLTGAMSGALRSSPVAQPIIIDYGSSENSFKVVTAMNPQQSPGPGTFLETLVVSEFIESAQKPFVVASGETIYLGVCEHL